MSARRKSAVIAELPPPALNDVPRMLRAMADEIEAGSYGDVDAIMMVTEDTEGFIRTFAAGKTMMTNHRAYNHAYALLHLGLANLVHKRGTEYQL